MLASHLFRVVSDGTTLPTLATLNRSQIIGHNNPFRFQSWHHNVLRSDAPYSTDVSALISARISSGKANSSFLTQYAL
jgi:hypothetical protein